MIAKLRGVVDSAGEGWVILDVQGVGYRLFISAKTQASLPGDGEATSLYTEMLVRQEQPILYGFATETERAWFNTLITVQGVGARVALALLSALTPDELGRAIQTGDKALICRADGVGPKLATRLLSELKGKINNLVPEALVVSGAGPSPPPGTASDVLSALENLGYKRAEAVPAVARAIEEEGATAPTATLIRRALGFLASKINGAA
jgi:holliday junction DNA helicase RuvA